jgi:Fe-S cluster assembly ATPase SufC
MKSSRAIAPKQPTVVVIAGPNGAGKSTAAPYLLKQALGILEGSMPFRVELDITGSDAVGRCILGKRQAPADCLANA